MKETNVSMKLHSLHGSHFVKTKHKTSEAEVFQRYVFWGKKHLPGRKDYMWVKHHTYEAPDNQRENKHQLVEYTSLFPCAGKGKALFTKDGPHCPRQLWHSCDYGYPEKQFRIIPGVPGRGLEWDEFFPLQTEAGTDCWREPNPGHYLDHLWHSLCADGQDKGWLCPKAHCGKSSQASCPQDSGGHSVSITL